MSIHNKDIRGWFGALLILLLVIGIEVSLIFIEVPKSNNDTFKMVIGMLVGSLGTVVYSIINKDSDEVDKLKLEVAMLRNENMTLREHLQYTDSKFMDLQSQVIDKLSIIANQFTNK
ncbi:MAG: hypothetical protein WAS72_05820 [Saprospiraceae bacterium]